MVLTCKTIEKAQVGIRVFSMNPHRIVVGPKIVVRCTKLVVIITKVSATEQG